MLVALALAMILKSPADIDPELADLRLFQRANVSGGEWAPAQADAFTIKRVTVHTDDNIRDVLRTNHVFPNGDAIAVCFILNQNLQNEHITETARIDIPSVKEGTPGTEFKVVLNGSLKQQIAAESADLQGSLNRLLDLPNLEPAPAMSFRTGNVVTNAANSQAQDESAVVSKAYLLQTLAYIRALSKNLPTAASQVAIKQAVVSELVESFEDLQKHYDVVRGEGQVSRWQEQTLLVSVLKNQEPVGDLSIYYCPKALYPDRDSTQFSPGLTPRAIFSIPIAHYYFWAVKPSTGATVSELIHLKVNLTTGNLEIELSYTGK